MQSAQIDLSRIDAPYMFEAVQGDTDRQIRILLTDDGEPYDVSDDTVSIWYKSSSTEGNFSDGITKASNELIITLNGNMTKNPGRYAVAALLNRSNGKVSTWNMVLNVQPLPGYGSEAAGEYFEAFQAAELAKEISDLNTRISNIVANAGDTGNNAELVDIRLGYDGTTYPTAGDAVRGQVSKIHENISKVVVITENYFPEDANRFNKDTTIPGFLSGAEGNISGTSGTYLTSDYIYIGDCVGGNVAFYQTYGSAVNPVFYRYRLYDKSRSILSQYSDDAQGFSIPTNAEYVRISFDNGSSGFAEDVVMLIASRNQVDKPEAYVPYIAPITLVALNPSVIPEDIKRPNPYKLILSGSVEASYDGVEEVHVNIPGITDIATYYEAVFPDGANRFNPSTTEPGYITGSTGSTGSLGGTSGTYVTSDYIYVRDCAGGNAALFFNRPDNSLKPYSARTIFYDDSKKVISESYDVAFTNGSIPLNASYVRFSLDGISNATKIMLVASPSEISTPSEFVSYTEPETGWKLNPSVIPEDISGDSDGSSKETNIVVGLSEEADFSTITEAVASIVGSSKFNVFNIMIEDGIYEEKDITLPDYVNLIGINRDYDKVWIKGELPDSALDSEITPCSTINLTRSNTLSGLKITAKNMRYPVHDESGNAQHDWIRLVDRCWIEHYGTEGAKKYREDNNLTETSGYNSLWTSCHAWGEGASQGAISHFNDCVFQSVEAAWYVHEGTKQESPYYHEFNNCIFNSIAPYKGTFFNRVAVTIDNTRQSSDKNKLVFNGCQFSGCISINAVYPIQLVINGGDPMVIARWKNGGSSIVSYFSDKCYPFISNHMKKLMYNGDDHLSGGEILAYSNMSGSAMPVVVKANSETDPGLFAGMAIGEADKGDPVMVLSGGYFYNTANSVGKYVGADDSGNVIKVSDKTKAFAIGLSGWWFKIL